MKKPIALIIMDGFGESKIVDGNAVLNANTPNLDNLIKEYPHTLISASGLDVGLPNGQMGNSEVGHTNIGAGRIVYQDLTRVSKAIEDGDLFKNEVLLETMKNAKTSALHLMGLVSDGGVHSHIDHLKGILKMAKENGVENVYVHAFTDGRDTDPKSALKYIQDIEDYMKELGVGKFASVSGRYYAMDRDKRWDRIKLAYDAMVNGKGLTASSATEAVENSYAEDKNDEFVLPTVIVENGHPVGLIKEGDSIVFGNFRPDRAREITRAIVDTDFTGFERPNMKTYFTCLTTYDITIKNVHVAFKPQSLENTLGEYLAKNGKKQLRTAETEKYAHVTFFFNGGVEEPNEGEDRELVPSPKVATYDLQPEMSAYEVTDKLLAKIDEDKYDFIVVNFANPDMVGHTGVIKAAIKAVETVDECVGKVVEKILSKGGEAIITADHGNVELMQDPETKSTITAHSTNPVPFILVGEKDKSLSLREGGRLCDIAPTILEMMNLDKPEQMTGESLIIK
ncbi:2,3-bisphosphoglycerate-independent phosphoglycerate mutase [Romboutsia sp. 1001216sp1]|uniref:2,3-bisphosphoglycerate-independent phosphoglycerate mutase n=1 Tax=Romboutsia sp. 1001216sp1 TaxID=2986997 RepID=UPI00232C30DC|nr:2,3-bisphosphoglycerate-independent phosphoglycerate mutase [Romboutsia sp. 1001216sp1]MDB8805323.1 2,3-bisphosphoglycerate-independent phosphoglycerate mutase [Romboutsia sp. 1001216sp1]MDB8807003.1 2,3-bisphosphoglycerate-independent phosphoglycerate mutase [Romboutsia sp. 1001216sp1]MDB8810968.1 2,3-bisphosphoglycerate-independent phosphoglycerate mutase [Romboutsia sp. 1001216sp1]MDB8816688.1 2,3-bisphosphoglycerate-independent phosphoglycerate mutase [Romboutsia sp. 1001216sp1]MDB88190